MYLKSSKGFTLIEMLIVILIIGILAAIAVPTLLGQRSKARIRAMETNVRGIESELRMIMDHYDQKSPIVFITAPGELQCIEYVDSLKPNNCLYLYPDIADTGVYKDVSDLITLYMQQQNIGLNAKSPYDGSPLLTVDDSSFSKTGHILLKNSSEGGISVSAWSDAGSNLLTVGISSH